MTKYDKIWVIDNEEAPHPVQVEVRGPLICLSLEELKQLWEASADHAVTDLWSGTPEGLPDFEEYLTSKGITIP